MRYKWLGFVFILIYIQYQAWETVYAIYAILQFIAPWSEYCNIYGMSEANIATLQYIVFRGYNILLYCSIYCRKEIAYFDIYVQLYILCQIWSYFYLQYCVYKHTHTSICLYMYIQVSFIQTQRHLSSRIRQDESLKQCSVSWTRLRLTTGLTLMLRTRKKKRSRNSRR